MSLWWFAFYSSWAWARTITNSPYQYYLVFIFEVKEQRTHFITVGTSPLEQGQTCPFWACTCTSKLSDMTWINLFFASKLYKPRNIPCMDPVEVDHSEGKTSRSLFGNGHVWYWDPLQMYLVEVNIILDSMTFWQNLLSSSLPLI